MELWELTALELGGLIQKREVSPVEAARAALDRMAGEQPRNNAFVTALEEERVLEKESYDQAREFIMRSACLEYKTKQSELRFYNKRAKEAWERLMKYREEMRKKPQKVDPSFSLWNIIGAVTSRHPSLNLTNIWQLTVYQLYDQFARVRDQVAFDVYSTRWAVWGKDKLDQSLWFKQERDNKV